MKLCPSCKIEKPLADFHGTKSKLTIQTYCRPCFQEYRRQHYIKHRAKYNAKTDAYRKRFRSHIQDLKSKTPCADCGLKFHFCVMDFDHLRDKKFNISKGFRTKPSKDILDEIAKCDLVCANCHRVRTWNRSH